MTRVDALEKQPPTVPLKEKIIPPAFMKQTWFQWPWTREENVLSLGASCATTWCLRRSSFLLSSVSSFVTRGYSLLPLRTGLLCTVNGVMQM